MIHFGPPVGGRLGAKMLPKSILAQVGRPYVAISALFWEVPFFILFRADFLIPFWLQNPPGNPEFGGTGAYLWGHGNMPLGHRNLAKTLGKTTIGPHGLEKGRLGEGIIKG